MRRDPNSSWGLSLCTEKNGPTAITVRRVLPIYLPQALQTLASPFSQSNFTPVFPHEGHVPLQPVPLTFLPLFALPMTSYPLCTDMKVEAAPRFELGMELLQSSALPLGYAASDI